jgi:SAM-dependent methyltransferase
MSEELIETGNRLLAAKEGLRWADEKIQAQYTGVSGERCLAQAVEFLELLRSLTPTLATLAWRGLDYGVGWGRMASLMTHFGPPRNLDCVDAWERSLERARECGLQNDLRLVSATLKPGDLPDNTYDFAYAYSIFTHLPEANVRNNAEAILKSLKPGGLFLFTIRQPKFINFLRNLDRVRPEVDRLSEDGYWFGNAQNADYGDSIYSEDWLGRHLAPLGELKVIGAMKGETTQIAVSLEKRP